MTIDFTLVIPTYNGAKRLPSLLDSLLAQTDLDPLCWQVIVVDNNSTDATSQVLKEYQQTWTSSTTNSSIEYVLETQQGAAFARQRGMQLAKSELVGFLDDDVVPASDWIASAYQFGLTHPNVGAYGGRIIGKFEVAPPENFKRIQSFLAIRDRGSSPHLYKPENLILPPSAAWVIKKQAWLETVPPQPKLSGRTGKSMVQGDDYEPLLHIHNAGWEIWYHPGMYVEHHIPASRLQDEYLLALSRGCGLCIFQLRLITSKNWEKPITLIKIVLGNLNRTILHFFKYRQQLRSDIVAQCEMNFFISGFLSPAYYFSRLLRDAFSRQGV